MASTFSTNLKIELIGTGDQSGTWGATTNTNLGTLLEQAIAGYATQLVTDSGVATVLTIPDGTSSTGRNYVIALTGALTANRTVEVPAVNKPYIFFNNTTGGFSVTVKVSGQTGVTIANGKKAIVYTNSTDVIEVANAPATEAGTQTLTNKTLTTPVINGFSGDTSAITIGTTQFVKDTSGNIGIGTSSPTQKLHVNGGNVLIGTAGSNAVLYLDSTSTYVRRNSSDGSLVFNNQAASNTIFTTNASETMRIDSSGNVGIGTSSPNQKVQVNAGATSSFMQFTNTTTGSTSGVGGLVGITSGGDLWLWNQSNYNVVFGSNNGERMRIDSSGNVGIGTSSPSSRLVVNGGTSTSQIRWEVNNSAFTQEVSTNAAVSAYVYKSNDASYHIWKVSSSEQMRLNSSGKLLVGTTTAASGGGVVQTIVGQGSNDGGIQLTSGTGVSGGGMAINSLTGGGAKFFGFTGNAGSETYTENMRIDSGGNLLVGTTGPVNLEKFNVTGSPANLISRFYNANASNPNGVGVFYSNLSPNGSSNAFFYAADSTALRFNVQSNGGIANYSANNTNLSDERLKKDIQPAGSYLDKICSIPVKTFLYTDQTDNDLNLGVIAQDVDAVAPELVCRDGWRDKDGELTDYLTIYQTDLQYALMKCIQELSAKNDALEARLAKLEGTQ